jgi:hypothetical protein
MSLVLSNSFKGENITNLIAPRKPIEYSNFSQLIGQGFRLFGSREDDRELVNMTEFELYFQTKIGESYFYELSPYLRKHLKITHIDFNISDVTKIRKGTNIYRWFSKIEWEAFTNSKGLSLVSKCNNTGIVDYETKLELIAMGIKKLNPNADLKFGKESLTEKKIGWRFYKFVDRRIPIRIRNLQESGILPWWSSMESKILQRTKNDERKNFEHATNQTQSDEEEGPKKVDLGSGIVAFFIVTFTSILISAMTFLCELHGHCHLFNKK